MAVCQDNSRSRFNFSYELARGHALHMTEHICLKYYSCVHSNRKAQTCIPAKIYVKLDKQWPDLPAFSARTVNRTSPAPWGDQWDEKDAPRWPAHHSFPPGHPAWSWPYWCTPGSVPVCSPPEAVKKKNRKRRVVYGCRFRKGNEEQTEKDVRKGEQASLAIAQTGLNKGRKGVGRKTHWAPRVAYL